MGRRSNISVTDLANGVSTTIGNQRATKTKKKDQYNQPFVRANAYKDQKMNWD